MSDSRFTELKGINCLQLKISSETN
uniref:Uncharacterized protein n=1 Tax=Arundo donax TaxID=35708 RepID=A0A0A8YG22_ARUDO